MYMEKGGGTVGSKSYMDYPVSTVQDVYLTCFLANLKQISGVTK